MHGQSLPSTRKFFGKLCQSLLAGVAASSSMGCHVPPSMTAPDNCASNYININLSLDIAHHRHYLFSFPPATLRSPHSSHGAHINFLLACVDLDQDRDLDPEQDPDRDQGPDSDPQDTTKHQDTKTQPQSICRN